MNVPEFIKKIDWSELRNQKKVLIIIIDELEKKKDIRFEELDGILNLIDAIQDYAVDDAKIIDGIHVYDFELEEERDASTPEENFARESAQRIFDELCESDGFHTDDQMSVEFISSIMADHWHADIIKAKLREQILDDMQNNCPEEFTYGQDGYTYDRDMREDYEGLVSKYILEQFNEGKTEKLWLCPHCGSDNVDIKKWVNINTDMVGTDCEEDEGYCNDCESRGELILSDVKANAHIVGFQVVDDVKGDIHPDMKGSFCLYNLSQANKMIRNSDDPTDCWKLLAIWTGDVEEPTLMFEGDPRD